MKKLLALMLVLSVASVANAALLISVGGVVDPPDTSINLMPSDTVTIDIWGDGQTPGSALYLFTINETSDGTVSGGTIVYPGNATYIAPGDDPIDYDWIVDAGYIWNCSI